MTNEELNRIRVVVRDEVTVNGEKVLSEIGKFMEDQLFPLIEEKADKSDIDNLGRRFDAFSTKTAKLNIDIQEIVSTPTVAHELKHKKQKNS